MTIWMLIEPPKAPSAMAPMSSACGANKALEQVGSLGKGLSRHAVAEIRNALWRRLSTGPMTSAPTVTPTTSAVCWRQGVAPTMFPVFRSCMTSPAMALEEATTAAMSNVARMSSSVARLRMRSPTTQTRRTVNSMVAMVMPDTGEFDEPTTPAM